MPASYRYALRTKAIAAVKRGEGKTAVSRLFQISRNTLDLWLKREEQDGDYKAITCYQQGYGYKIKDWQKFESSFSSMGIRPKPNSRRCGAIPSVSKTSAMLCVKLESVEKKTYGYRERDELKRQEFQERLKGKSAAHLVVSPTQKSISQNGFCVSLN